MGWFLKTSLNHKRTKEIAHAPCTLHGGEKTLSRAWQMGPVPQGLEQRHHYSLRPSMAHLLTDGPSDGHGEDAHGASPQILPLPLLAEGSELFLLFLFQCCAVLCLE